MIKPIDAIKYDIQLNAECFLQIIKLFLSYSKYNQNIDEKTYDANGFSTFVGGNLVFDCTVFVHEVINFLKIYDSNIYQVIVKCYGLDALNEIKTVRNNMHLFNKNGSYKNKAKKIVNSQLEKFDMLEVDFLNKLRTDICKIFLVKNGKKTFLGTNYFYFHYVYEVGGEKWDGSKIRNYAQMISEILKFFSSYSKNSIRISAIKEKDLKCNIFFQDARSQELLSINCMDESTNFRLLLSLTQIGWINALLFEIIDAEACIEEDRKWRWFLTKYLAIKYDEIFDNIQNLLVHSVHRDELRQNLEENNFKIEELSHRILATKIRNTLHYNISDMIKGKDAFNSFLVKNKLSTNEFDHVFRAMKNDLNNLIVVLQKCYF